MRILRGFYITFILAAVLATFLLSHIQANLDDGASRLVAQPSGERTDRISISSEGVEANGASAFGANHDTAVSADGRFVAFASQASNLVPGDNNRVVDIFVRDLDSGRTERVSVASGGEESNGGSASPALSADGRYAAYISMASNLVPGDTNRYADVFVHDRVLGKTTRVSVSSAGAEASSFPGQPTISADGRYVAFESLADSLAPGDTNGSTDIFVHDRQTGQTRRVSVRSDGGQANSDSWSPALSGDGRYVAFETTATNLSQESGVISRSRIFVHDQIKGKTELVSVSSTGEPANHAASQPSISADGRYVAFVSTASNLVTADTNGYLNDIFVHDRQNGETGRVSVSSDGGEADNSSGEPVISADGRYVAFTSLASNLVGDDHTGHDNIFVHDRQKKTTRRISIAVNGEKTDGDSWNPAIDANGEVVVFASSAMNLVSGDTNWYTDIFVGN